MVESIVQELAKAYSIEITECNPHQNVWCLSTSLGKKCLKKVNYSGQDASFIWLATENLNKNGFKRFNRFVLTKDKKPYFEINDQIYILTDWINGWESSYTDHNELQIAAQTLSEMHLASQGFKTPDFSRQRIKWGYWIDNFAERRTELIAFKAKAAGKESFFDKLFFMYADIHIAQAEKALSMLNNSTYQELVKKESPLLGFCHHDYAHHNIIIDQSQAFLIDFDYLICDLRCHDLASLMLRAIKDNEWQTQYAEVALRAYADCVALYPGEKNVIYGFLTFPQDFWQAGYTYYVERNRSKERMDKKIKSCLTATNARIKCLRELAEICDER